MKQDIKWGRTIPNYVSGLDEQVLGNMKLEMGMDYCMRYGYQYAREFWKQKEFWIWFNRIWEIGDRHFLMELSRKELDTVDVDYYRQFKSSFTKRFNMTGKHRKAIQNKIITNNKNKKQCQKRKPTISQ